MRSINLLKVLINITYYILLVGLLFHPLFMIYGLFSDNVSISFYGSGSLMYELMDPDFAKGLSGSDYFVVGLSFVKSVLFFLAIHFLRKGVLRMIDVTMYDKLVTNSLGLTGNCIIIYAIFNACLNSIIGIIYRGKLTIGLDFDSFNSFIFMIILGLVFILMSKVIKRGIELKLENDLTI